MSHSLRRPNSFVKLSDGGLVLVFQDALMFGLREHGFDGFYQLARRVDTQLHRYTGSGSFGLIDEVDVERMFERHAVGMIVGDVALFQIDPLFALFTAAVDFCLMGNDLCT